MRHSSLATDLYQLTMAAGYWRQGLADRRAVFHLFFRRPPFGGAYAIACGLAPALEALADLRFASDDLSYLATLRGNDGKELFSADFLDYLAGFELRCDLDAVAEGTVVFAGEPLLRVTAPLLEAQLLETPLLNALNFPSLVATKAARVCCAAGGDQVLEFGLRRAQGPDGAASASRAAWLGGCAATSNVLAGQRWGIPVRGTHAHSWVQVFAEEEAAFTAYAEVMPNNCVFLVDTYDTVGGIRRAIAAGRELARRGHRLLGLRLDSGDLLRLSRLARQQLDQAGFTAAKVIASNDLDEYRITELKAAGAAIDVWGVGTRLVTAWDEPALGGVFKLAALERAEGGWRPVIKVSDDLAKCSTPGRQQVRRYYRDETAVGDLIYDLDAGIDDSAADFETGPTGQQRVAGDRWRDLLQPVLRGGVQIDQPPPLSDSRQLVASELASMPSAVRRLRGAAAYPVRLEAELDRLRQRLIAEHRAVDQSLAETGERA